MLEERGRESGIGRQAAEHRERVRRPHTGALQRPGTTAPRCAGGRQPPGASRPGPPRRSPLPRAPARRGSSASRSARSTSTGACRTSGSPAKGSKTRPVPVHPAALSARRRLPRARRPPPRPERTPLPADPVGGGIGKDNGPREGAPIYPQHACHRVAGGVLPRWAVSKARLSTGTSTVYCLRLPKAT